VSSQKSNTKVLHRLCKFGNSHILFSFSFAFMPQSSVICFCCCCCCKKRSLWREQKTGSHRLQLQKDSSGSIGPHVKFDLSWFTPSQTKNKTTTIKATQKKSRKRKRIARTKMKEKQNASHTAGDTHQHWREPKKRNKNKKRKQNHGHPSSFFTNSGPSLGSETKAA
jgi:hypothetical protein